MTLPEDGGDPGLWGATMNTHINVGHDADGTHKKSEVLTAMEWSPTTYAAGETMTFPNGLIMKTGEVTISATSGTVTFGTAFTTVLSITTSIGNNIATLNTITITDLTKDDFDWVVSDASMDKFWWTVIGV